MDNHSSSNLINAINLGCLLITTLFGWVLQDLDLILSVITKLVSISTFIIFFFLNKDNFFIKVKETWNSLKKKK